MNYYFIKNGEIYKMDPDYYEIDYNCGQEWVTSKWNTRTEHFVAYKTANEAWQILADEAERKKEFYDHEFKRIKDGQLNNRFKIGNKYDQ